MNELGSFIHMKYRPYHYGWYFIYMYAKKANISIRRRNI